MAIDIVVPPLGESIKQALLVKWHKSDGQPVAADEPVCELETDKANVDVPAPTAGKLAHLRKEGENVEVGQPIGRIEPAPATASAPAAAASASPDRPANPSNQLTSPLVTDDYSPGTRQLLQEHHLDPKLIPHSGPQGRLTAEDVSGYVSSGNGNRAAQGKGRLQPPPPHLPPAPAAKPAPIAFDAEGIHRQPLSRIRKRIAQTLVQAQHNAALLTTFNEIDCSAIIELRNKYKERFQETHGASLGFMSFFARAVVLALGEFPTVNAFLENDEVVYHQFVNLGIAVSTERGLAVPVLRNAHRMTFAQVETEIKRLAAATRDGKLSPDELSGGTFTITNGGVFGSLLSTPIVNPPQSAILGMHAIQKRPVVINDKLEIRSMMYVALSYDHRLVDGRESVSFLVRIKQYLEDPARMLLQI